MSDQPLQKRRYMPGLDGLRALAVLLVIIYHLNPDWLPGGLLGVGIFFTLSGYLITDILVGQWDTDDRFDMKDFWIRRARRLLPAMVTMIAVIIISSLAFDSSRLTSLRGDIPAALLYMSNWWFIFHQVSYFESFGPPSPLGHLWSLAVEEQYYLIWPLLLLLGLTYMRKRVVLAGWILSLALVSALSMAFIYVPGNDPSRVYYGTDTRGFALLIGAALAIVWPSRKLKPHTSVKARRILDMAGVICLIFLCYYAWNTNQYEPFLYRGGLLLISLISAVLIAVLVHPVSRLSRVMACRPLRWLGVRSYGLYLWHYPVITLTTPLVDTDGLHILRTVLQLFVSFLLSALSWKYIEEPIRRKGLRQWVSGIKLITNRDVKKRYTPVAVISLFFLTVCAGTVNVYILDKAHTGELSSAKTADVSANTRADKIRSLVTSVSHTTAAADNNTHKKAQAGHSGSKGPSTPSSEDKYAHTAGIEVTAIGDSVMLDVQSYIQDSLPNAVVDGKVGRQMMEAPAVLNQLRQNGQLGSNVIVELGTNGAFTKNQLDQLLSSLKDAKRIILVNTRVPRPWESIVNKQLAEAASADSRITMVDWYSASSGKNSYFEKDGVHLKPKGAKAYASLLTHTLNATS